MTPKMATPKHSSPAVPWATLMEPGRTIIDSNGAIVCDMADCPDEAVEYARAALIVKAVNCHDELVEACRELMEFGQRQGWRHVAIDKATKVLAKAEPRPCPAK